MGPEQRVDGSRTGRQREPQFQEKSAWGSEVCLLLLSPGAAGGYNSPCLTPKHHAAEFVRDRLREVPTGPQTPLPAQNTRLGLRVLRVPAQCGNGPLPVAAARALDDCRLGRLGTCSGSHWPPRAPGLLLGPVSPALAPGPHSRTCQRALQRGTRRAGALEPEAQKGTAAAAWLPALLPCAPAARAQGPTGPSGPLAPGKEAPANWAVGRDCGTDQTGADKAPPSRGWQTLRPHEAVTKIIRCYI